MTRMTRGRSIILGWIVDAVSAPTCYLPHLLIVLRMSCLLFRCAVGLVAVLSMAVPAHRSPAQSFADDFPAAGLVGEFRDEHGNTCRRLDSSLAFVWYDRTPDPRIGGGKFTAVWRGLILLRTPGMYRLDAFVEGDVRVLLDGEPILEASASESGWGRGIPTELPAGLRELEVEFTRTQTNARMNLFWSGPDFEREPIPSTALFHELDEDASQEVVSAGVEDPFERGRQWVLALRCVACHEIPTASSTLPAPALDRIAGNLSASWISEWLTQDAMPGEQSLDQRKMPHFDLSDEDARAVAAFLTQRPSAVDEAPKNTAANSPKTDSSRQSQSAADREAGERLFLSLGCLACHRRGDEGHSSLMGGMDLSRVGEKRDEDFFRRWLSIPETINRDHRMPVFPLSSEETSHLAKFLSSLVAEGEEPAVFQASEVTSAPTSAASSAATERDLVEQGRRLVHRHHCGACHTLPEAARVAAIEPVGAQPSVPLTAGTSWENACITAEQRASGEARSDQASAGERRPRYRLAAEDAAAVQHYVAAVTAVRDPQSAMVDGAEMLLRSNCLACHPRGLTSGISATAMAVAEGHADVVEHVAALIPPSLNSVGDKLHNAALRDAIERDAIERPRERRRPWLSVRMPRYPMKAESLDRLLAWFVEHDRIPAPDDEASAAATDVVSSAESAPKAPQLQESVIGHPDHSQGPHGQLDAATLNLAGGRLVTSEGLGCISCHAIGGVQPAAAPINARGPELAQLGDRIRRSWFRRWVANPLRIVPRVEMPAVAIPVPGVLDADLTRQIDAVWQVLNLEGFRPPKPNPVRVVRRQGIESAGEPAAVLTDVLRMDEHQWIKPLLIGLPNRHNVLIDLQSARLEGWWIGDTARQHVEGKSWYWESTAQNLWSPEGGSPEFTLLSVSNQEEVTPRRQGQFLTELDQWQHVVNGLQFDHRLRFEPTGETEEVLTVNVRQTITAEFAASDGDPSGWRREIEISHLPDEHVLRFQVAPVAASVELERSQDRRRLRIAGAGHLEIELSNGGEFDEQGAVLLEPDADRRVNVDLRYRAALAVDKFPALVTTVNRDGAHRPRPQSLHVAPGFTTVQLPLPDALMPTGFAWEEDGAMVLTSLEGRVWRARDTDGDGLPDQATSISDDLATPFGIAAGDGYLDVINKYALLRLFDQDGDGVAERTETLASGWGHTADYHDWALGLPRTDDGGYWVTLSCQQDERSDEAAHLRGTVIQLVPREPTREDPHAFDIQPFSAGHRFPIGIAVNRDGDAFVSDNQGNYNPFNELNHLIAGARYGFINRNEKRPGFAPPLTPPAVDIPHPWTRSVNGICFLTTPESIPDSRFGPYEGHLVGCEYDTQRLIRISLQEVEGVYQGAAYPLTYPKPVEGPPLLGPISCAVSPAGDLVVGNIRDSGWGGGQNTGNVVRMRMDEGALPAGIAEIKALPNGFRLQFTGPISPPRAEDPASYNIASYTRTSTPQYGGDDQQRRTETIRQIVYDSEQNTAMIELGPLRENFVYEFQTINLAADGAEFFPAEAFYTLRAVPRNGSNW